MRSVQSPKKTGIASDEDAAAKRLHERLSVQRQVYLCWKDARGNQVLRAHAVDVSRFGILVEAERAIAAGTVISVQMNATMLGKACVRHCTPKGIKYRIGLHMPDRMIRDL